MERVILERFETSDQGTFGKIRIGDDTFYTLELPWRDNRNDFSCIPSGLYECRFTMSAHFRRKMFLINRVDGRAGVRIHSANLAGDKMLGYRSQLSGCIALGLCRGIIEGQKAILVSSSAVRKFEAMMKRESFILEVLNGY